MPHYPSFLYRKKGPPRKNKCLCRSLSWQKDSSKGCVPIGAKLSVVRMSSEALTPWVPVDVFTHTPRHLLRTYHTF